MDTLPPNSLENNWARHWRRLRIQKGCRSIWYHLERVLISQRYYYSIVLSSKAWDRWPPNFLSPPCSMEMKKALKMFLENTVQCVLLLLCSHHFNVSWSMTMKEWNIGELRTFRITSEPQRQSSHITLCITVFPLGDLLVMVALYNYVVFDSKVTRRTSID